MNMTHQYHYFPIFLDDGCIKNIIPNNLYNLKLHCNKCTRLTFSYMCVILEVAKYIWLLKRERTFYYLDVKNMFDGLLSSDPLLGSKQETEKEEE